MRNDGKPRLLCVLSIAGVMLLMAMACSGLVPAGGGKATATPTGQIGAIEAGTPGLNGNKKDYEVWTGTITSQTSRQYMSNGSVVNTCKTDWITDLDFAVDTAGNLAGQGQVSLANPRECSPNNNLVPNTSGMTVSLYGDKGSAAININLKFSGFQPSPSADFGGYMLLASDGTCPGNSRTIKVPLTGNGSAEAQLDLGAVMSGCGGSSSDVMSNQSLVKLTYRFRCSELPADENDPILKELCQ
jgi:hypothetical protein